MAQFLDTYKRVPLTFVSGKGARLTDDQGKTYIDFTGGIGVNILGHAHPRLVAALQEQASRLIHVSNYYMTRESQRFAEILCESHGMEAAFFANSGAEANEAAIKIARKYGNAQKPAKNVVLSLTGSFHGRTLATVTASGQERLHQFFDPFPAGFRYLEARLSPGLTSVRQTRASDAKISENSAYFIDEDPPLTKSELAIIDLALGPDVCAFIAEIVQGESGVRPVSLEFLREIAQICKKRDIFFISDEIQCGLGRSGEISVAHSLGLEPDILTLAKGIAGGVPASVVLTRGRASQVLQKGDHGTTFGGNPLAAACGRVVLETISDPDFLKAVRAKALLLVEEVLSWRHSLVKEVRGRGLMVGVVVKGNPDEIKLAAVAEGLLVLTAGMDTIRLLPPLTIEELDLKEGLKIFHRVLDRCAKL